MFKRQGKEGGRGDLRLGFHPWRWLRNRPALKGRITRADGVRSVPGVVVMGGGQRAITTRSGHFVLEGVPTGVVSLSLYHGGELFGGVVHVHVSNRGRVVTIEKPIVLPYGQGPSVRGKVLDEEGHPLRGALLKFGQLYAHNTDAEGCFHTQLPVGVHLISVIHSGDVYEHVDIAHICWSTHELPPIQVRKAHQHESLQDSAVS